ncbi:MAG TPA: tripartite tricarboxylate transporter substrate binding protein [Burkholderiales bacterium]|nr:tripartite tricarboxylate transporter substrate binding protein [Burkholderiales bacterium]
MASNALKFMAGALLSVVSIAATAQKFPERPIRLILGVAPGGGQDTIARAMSPRLAKVLGVNTIVDNRPGGSGTIGVEIAKQAAPDGHTLLMISASNVIHPLLYGAPYDLLRDFAPVGQLVTQPYLLVVPQALPVKSVNDLIAYAKAQPGKLNFGSAGNGTVTHLAAELFTEQAHVEATHVPYKGMGPVYPDLIAGRVQMAFSTIVSAQGHVKANRLRALAVTSAKRTPSAPGVPTLAESGLPGYAVTQWYGVLAPAATPRTIVGTLSGAFAGVVQEPDMAEYFARDGAEGASSTPQQFAAHLKSEQERWNRVIKRAGLQGLK